MAITTRKLATLDPANFDPGPATADTVDEHSQHWELLEAGPPGPRWWPPTAAVLTVLALAGVVTLAAKVYTVGLALLALAVAGLSGAWIAAGYRGVHRHRPGPR